jgi:hypothetical protein
MPPHAEARISGTPCTLPPFLALAGGGKSSKTAGWEMLYQQEMEKQRQEEGFMSTGG